MYLLPLVSTLFSGIFSGSMFARLYGHRGAGIINVFCLFVAFLSSLMMWYEVVFASSEVFIDLFNVWFTVGSFNVYWSLYFDLTTVHLLLTVTSVSFAVHCYALVYMKSDPHLNLFMCYLSLFTFFMCVLVTGQDLVVMLVGWEGMLTQCLSGDNEVSLAFILNFWNSRQSKQQSGQSWLKRHFYKPRLPAKSRRGSHTSLFKQVLTGFLLGDGWIVLHGEGARLGISITEKFKDVAAWYRLIFFLLGYTDTYLLADPLTRTSRKTSRPYYQIRTFSFSSLISYYHMWYLKQENGKYVKSVPKDLYDTLTPLALAIWIMGDGSGLQDGGFKISTHGFTQDDSQYLCDLLFEKFGIEANVVKDGKGLFCIRVLKRSVTRLYWLVKPFLLPSCEYKFRFVNQQ